MALCCVWGYFLVSLLKTNNTNTKRQYTQYIPSHHSVPLSKDSGHKDRKHNKLEPLGPILILSYLFYLSTYLIKDIDPSLPFLCFCYPNLLLYLPLGRSFPYSNLLELLALFMFLPLHQRH